MDSRTFYDWFAQTLAGYFKKDWSGALLAVVILAVAIELVTDGRSFFHTSNLMTILNNSAALGVIAGGMTLVILTAGIDFSVGDDCPGRKKADQDQKPLSIHHHYR